MLTVNYKRTVEELEKLASMFWSSELSQQEADLSIIPTLINTQEKFIAILNLDVPNLNSLFEIVNNCTLPANLFVKHLVVLADFGGQMLERLNSQFSTLFPDQKLDYIWKGQSYSYKFKKLPVSGILSNAKLGIDGKQLLNQQSLSELHQDIIAILLMGSGSTDEQTATVLAKCEISNYIGKPDKLEDFIKQRYIWVSRITAGSKSNTIGQIAQIRILL